MFQANWKEKQAEVAFQYLYLKKIDIKTKAIVRNKEGHYIMIKGTVQQEEINLVNTHSPNIGAPKFVKQIFMDINGEINSNSRGF